MTRRRESGLTLTIALAALLVVAAAGAALQSATVRSARDTVGSRDRLAARYAAESGVERARCSLARDAAYAGETMRFDAFDVTVRVTPAAGGRSGVRVLAVGPRARASVGATLRRGSSLPVVEAWFED